MGKTEHEGGSIRKGTRTQEVGLQINLNHGTNSRLPNSLVERVLTQQAATGDTEAYMLLESIKPIPKR
jgi:hypothetical protein